jgi:ATP-binding cassette subfamily B protein
VFQLLVPYMALIILLILLTIGSNALNLWVPRIVAAAIDQFDGGTYHMIALTKEFFLVAIGIFALTYLQSIVQVYASERVAKDMRNQLVSKISHQSYSSVESLTPAMLLTNLTSDIDAIKNFISQAIPSLVSSAFLIIGSAVLLLLLNWKLALAVLTVMPIIGFTFFFVFRKVRALFKQSQAAIDSLNAVINESILGSAIIRLVNAQQREYHKFLTVNTRAKDISMSILRLFSSLMPVIAFCTNVATLIILLLGGRFIMQGTMTLGDFAAFNSYLTILIFPILIIGFMSTVIAQADASYARIKQVLDTPDQDKSVGEIATLRGDVALDHITLCFGEKAVLNDVSLVANAHTKTAIVGPTAAGKTQLLYVLTGLLVPNSGTVLYDGKDITTYNKRSLHQQIGFVFQDSVLFNMSLRENITFGNVTSDEALLLAIETAELDDFVDSLPDKLDTIVSERGMTLSGGQKQRVMLARALAINPTVLLLDDFTARVDNKTEQSILQNLARNYPHLTLISVTQTILSVEHYDQIILLMEGEILAAGTHDELMHTSPEYVQIVASQQSTTQYEV